MVLVVVEEDILGVVLVEADEYPAAAPASVLSSFRIGRFDSFVDVNTLSVEDL
jgi:hypothetical protein